MRGTVTSHAVRLLVLAGLLASMLNAPTADGSAPNAAADPIAAAAAELAAEFQAARRTEPLLLPRETPDYFAEPPIGMTNGTLLAAMNRRLDRDESVDAYVKWQLTSARQGKLEGDDAAAARRILDRNPDYPKHPSVGNQAALMKSLRGKTVEQLGLLNEQWAARVAAIEFNALPIMRFRDELVARLPDEPATFMLAVRDLAHRGNAAGWDTQLVKSALYERLQAWAAEADPAEVARLTVQLRQVRHLPHSVVLTHMVPLSGSNVGSLEWITDRHRGIQHEDLEAIIRVIHLPAPASR